MKKLTILGAGAWGTALAMVARRAGLDVLIQARELAVVRNINYDHENKLFLSGYPLDPQIHATNDLAHACAELDVLLLVTPAQHLRAMAMQLVHILNPKTPIVICSKGIEQKTAMLMSEILAQILPQNPVAILSGPTFAEEVAKGLPTAVTLATRIEGLGEKLTESLANPYFRIYRTDDLIGAEIGGAVKNVLAIACGIASGRKMGENTRAALVTRGLAEIIRIAKAKGAKIETLMGLSGIGDLTLTCSAIQSRNFSLGYALGEGHRLEDILKERNSIAEGIFSAESVDKLGQKLRIDTPICSAVNSILNSGHDIDEIISDILKRPYVSESL